jgi:adenine phosphoribosyltransferase
LNSVFTPPLARHQHADASTQAQLKAQIRTIPDWPSPGVQFRDITTLLQNGAAFQKLISAFVTRYQNLPPEQKPTVVAGVDARGFILGAVIAHELGLGFVPIRKQGKLPFETVTQSYELEYGQASIELHTDAVGPQDRVLLVDDLIATGGTLQASVALLESQGAQVLEACAIVDLPELGGSQRLLNAGVNLFTLLSFEGH